MSNVPLQDLAKEVLTHLLSYLPLNSKLALFCTCKQFNSLVTDKRAFIHQSVFGGRSMEL